MKRERIIDAIYAVCAFAAALLLWEAAIYIFSIPTFTAPPPTLVFATMWRGLWLYTDHLSITLYSTVMAFIIALGLGVTLGTLVSEIRFVDRTIMPILIALQSMPRIALAPIIIIWFGYGPASKIALGAFTAFFPIFLNTVHGMRMIDSEQIALMRSLRASRFQIFWKIKLPNALPFLLAGANIGIIFAMLAVIVGEFLGANRGVGYLIVTQGAQMDTAGVMAGIFFLSLVGVVFHYGLQYLRRRLLFWSAGTEAAGAPM